MSDQFFMIASAVLAGNLFTLMFIWGAYHGFKTPDDELKLVHIGAMLIPAAIVGISAYIYG